MRLIWIDEPAYCGRSSLLVIFCIDTLATILVTGMVIVPDEADTSRDTVPYMTKEPGEFSLRSDILASSSALVRASLISGAFARATITFGPEVHCVTTLLDIALP